MNPELVLARLSHQEGMRYSKAWKQLMQSTLVWSGEGQGHLCQLLVAVKQEADQGESCPDAGPLRRAAEFSADHGASSHEPQDFHPPETRDTSSLRSASDPAHRVIPDVPPSMLCRSCSLFPLLLKLDLVSSSPSVTPLKRKHRPLIIDPKR